MSKLYIAYGSNLNKRQMRRRCPSARPLGKFTLKDARLVFRVYADLDLVPGAEVPCGLWRIDDADERALDNYEGLHRGKHGYYKDYILLKYQGKPEKAMLYLMQEGEGVAPPSSAYAQTIREGYQDFKMNPEFLNAAIKHSWDEKNPSEVIRQRRERQRRREGGSKPAAVVSVPESLALRRQKVTHPILNSNVAVIHGD